MNAVTDAILAATPNQEVREAMLMGSWLESGWSPTAVGDHGTSFGPFQMHIGGALTAAGGSPAQAEDPVWATQHMLSAYEAGVNSVSQAEWAADPEFAAQAAAVKAEAPQVSYWQSQGTARVNQAWAATQSVLAGNPGTTGAPKGGVPSGAPTSATTTAASSNPGGDLFSGFFGGLLNSLFPGGTGSLPDLLERAGLIILGGMILLLGIYMLVGKQALQMTPIGRELGMTREDRQTRSDRIVDRREARERRQQRGTRTAAQEERAERTLALRERRLSLAERTEQRHAGGGNAQPGRKKRT